jgi:hypothetical protein
MVVCAKPLSAGASPAAMHASSTLASAKNLFTFVLKRVY